jgi:IS5 family transposase
VRVPGHQANQGAYFLWRDAHRGQDLSLFEPSTEIIRKGKAGKTNEFDKVVKIQEAENQIITDYEVYDQRPHDTELLIPAIETHEPKFGRTPRVVAADVGFYSAKNEAAAKAKGVKRISVPNRPTKSAERKREQKKRWCRNDQIMAPMSSATQHRAFLARRRYATDPKFDTVCNAGARTDALMLLQVVEKHHDQRRVDLLEAQP